MSIATLQSGADVVADDLATIVDRVGTELARMSGDSLLVAGGGGFLGHYLVQAALAWNRTERGAPIEVTVFDNWVRGVPDWLTALDSDPHLTLRTFDITQPMPADVGHHDWIIHAASIASPTYYRKYPIETMDANVNGLRNLLEHSRCEQAAGTPVKGFLYFSTSEIYGDPTPDHLPTPEEYRGNVSCTGPRACYDESKRYGETLCVNFAQVHGVPVRVARPFNNYGPGLKITDRRVIPDFARDIFAGRDIVMLSPGTPTRTFCYISDAITGYFKVLVRGRDGEAYNIGTESPEVSIAELADQLASLATDRLGYTGSVVHRSSEDRQYLVDNPNRRCPVITKARTELGFDPVVGVPEGLWRALLWYRDNSTAEES